MFQNLNIKHKMQSQLSYIQDVAQCNTILYSLEEARRQNTGMILGLHPANERQRYFVITSLIGWVQA